MVYTSDVNITLVIFPQKFKFHKNFRVKIEFGIYNVHLVTLRIEKSGTFSERCYGQIKEQIII